MSSGNDFSRVLSHGKVKSQSKKPFDHALVDLMAYRATSYPRLSTATKSADPTGKGLSHAYLHRLAHGAKPPPPQTIVTIATALNVAPEYFREYREHVLSQRVQAISTQVDYDKVLAALEALAQPPTEDREIL